MRSTVTAVATFQKTRTCHGADQVGRTAVEADDGELVGPRLHRLEQLGRQLRPLRLHHGVALGRELGAHDLEASRPSARRSGSNSRWRPGSEHALVAAVAQQEGALAILHRHTQNQKNASHFTPPSIRLAAHAAKRRFEIRGTRVPDASSRESGGPGLEPGGVASTASPFAELAVRRSKSWTPRSARAISAPAQSRSQGVWFVREAFRPDDRTATEARVRFPSGVSAFQAEPERRSGIRTRDTMLIRHLLYPTELSSLVRSDRNRTGDLRGHSRRSATELRMPSLPSFGGTRDTQSAPRRPGLNEPGPEAERRSALMTQVDFARKRKSRPEVALPGALCSAGHSPPVAASLR